MVTRSLAMHGAILAVAGVLALRTYTADEDAKIERHTEAEIWKGDPSSLQRVRFEHKTGTMILEPRTDNEGRYFIGTVVKDKAAQEAEKEKKANDPHAQDPHGQSAEQEAATTKPTVDAQGKTTAQFIAVADGTELVELLAPLKALRVLGKIEDARKAEFGFDTDEGKLFVTINGKEHGLVFGGSTPGGSDRYAKDPATGEAYVIPGNIQRDLVSADQRLVERKMHAWEEKSVKRVKITVGDSSRELVRNEEKADFWSSPDKPAEKDETASNWMSKVERLRVTRYEGEKPSPPVQPQDVVVKIEYFDARRPIGYLELVRRPGEGDKAEYLAKTEHTRWYATVLRSSAEQIDQDVKSVVTP